MVFESVLAQVLNSVLGDYVENLDTNQLSVGIWGGDVELKNLLLKQSALDELDLPVQTVYGSIGKLVLKIPWKNLYGAAFVINVEDIYILAEPNQQVKYNPVKESKKVFEAKLKEIKKVEEVKKLEAEKDKPKADYSFVEKLITQIIKNVQLNIKNIHIRYEDKITTPGKPFALGITLSELNVVSTDDKWTPAITQENISKIYKIVKLEGLAVYWNCKCSSYGHLARVDLLHKMQAEIASKKNKPNYSYILGPINASARLKMNQKPEHDSPAFSIPKINLNLDMEKLAIAVSKSQYQDIIALAESMDRMSRGIPYRKYRPNVPYKKHYKTWWRFAYTCILETDVRRRKRNWSWDHIMGHRNMCRDYGTLYNKKLRNAANQDELKKIAECEKNLDIFNIVIIRQRIEMETEKLEKTQKATAKKGWLGWMWGSSPSNQELENLDQKTHILKQFEEAMTPEEKSRLYKAIDYQENAAPAMYPEAYIDNSCVFVLRTLQVELRDDDSKVKRVLFSELKGVKCRLDTRPASSGVKIDVKIDDLSTVGLKQDDHIPKIITSETSGGAVGLLEVSFELNPIDKLCDQRLHLTVQPLMIVYDAETMNKIVDIFKVPDDSNLKNISAAAGSGLNNMKEKSAIGLQYAIQNHPKLDVKLHLNAPYVVVPYGGKYTGDENVLVVNLGCLKIYSVELTRKTIVQMRSSQDKGFKEQEIMNEMIAQSYDQFNLELTGIQILMAQSDEDWKTCLKTSQVTKTHLLHPVNIMINYHKCLFTDDPKFPLNKLYGELPSLKINLSDSRLLLLLALVTSIPLPESDIPEPTPLTAAARTLSARSSMMAVNKFLDIQENAHKTKKLLAPKVIHNDFVQFTTVDVKFVMSEFILELSHQETTASEETGVASIAGRSLELNLVQQTYNTSISLQLASINVQQERESGPVHIISTLVDETKDEDCLFYVKFTQVDKKSPELHSVYKSCESSLCLDFGHLIVTLHQEGILSLMQYSQTLQSQVAEITGSNTKDRIATTRGRPLSRRLSQISEGFSTATKHVRKKSRNVVNETILFRMTANLKELSVRLETDKFKISSLAVKGIWADIITKKAYTQINAKLHDIQVLDLNPKTVHREILCATADEALATQIVLNNLDETVDSEKSDIIVEVTMGGIRIIFLNWFVTKILNFLNKFQTAQQKIIDASAAAALHAKENMKEAYTKAKRISLNINLKAPDIIVPVNSQNYECLFLDLGFISMSNTFLTLDVKREQISAVIDDLKISLTDLKLQRVLLDQQYKLERECTLLEPLTVNLDIKRNLSSSWYNSIPDIGISGKINTIKLKVSKVDYDTIMDILAQNLAEGKDEIEHVGPVEKQSVATETHRDASSTLLIHKTLSSSTTRIDEVDAKVHTSLKFTFAMEEFIIDLFSGGTKTMSGESADNVRKSINKLAKFSLEGLSLKGKILSDGSIITSVLLVNCILQDMREISSGKLNRLIERSQSDTTVDVDGSVDSSNTPAPIRSMIDVTFQMKENDMFADIRIYSFTLVLSVNYLMTLADFFKAQEVPQNPVLLSEMKTKSTASQTMPVQEKQMTINLKLEKPDIILVEDMNNIDTDAMMLNSEIKIKVRMAGSHQVINGIIQDLEVYTCCYNPAKRAETRNNVLHPVSISLAGSTPEHKGLHVELLVTDVHLGVSPATIQLLNNVLATLSKKETTGEEETEEQINYENIWSQHEYKDSDFWFLKTDTAIEASEELQVTTVEKKVLEELCIVSMPSIVLTVEAGVGNKTLPMLLLQTTFKGSVRNWSSELNVEATLSLEMGYFNNRLALWEPLIEPMEVVRGSSVNLIPWEIRLEVEMTNQDEHSSAASPLSEFDSVELQIPQPAMSIDLISETTLELTVTKTCLEVLKNLGKAFASAITKKEVHAIANVSAYKVVNEIGTPVTLLLEEGSFKMFGSDETREVILKSSAEVPLHLKSEFVKPVSLQFRKDSASEGSQYNLIVKVNDRNCTLTLPVDRADKRFFMLNYRGDCNDNWGIISDVQVDEGVTIITLRSILQVHNHFNVPIEVYYMTNKGNELQSIATIEPDSTVNIPVRAVYTQTNELFFSVSGYTVTTSPYIWKDLQTSLSVTKLLQCTPKETTKGKDPFIIKAVGEMEQIYYENTTRHTMASTCYNIHLRPAIVLKNFLPIDIVCCFEDMPDEFPVKAGDTLQLPNVEPGKTVLVVRIPEYLEKEWSCRQTIVDNPPEFTVWTFHSYDSPTKMSLDLGMHILDRYGSMVKSLYCPFWMLNKTGLMLGYRKSKKTEKHEAAGTSGKTIDENLNILHHPANFPGPILFSFNAKNFFGKKKASIRVEQGVWSDKFSLDVAGSSGVIACKANKQIYQVGVHNQLTYNGLTKQVTFTPYYVIINNAPFAIECQESDRPADPWVKVEPKSCTALWPLSDLDDKLLRLRIVGTNFVSAPFLYTESHTTLLKFNNKYGGINVDIQLTEGAVYINLAAYSVGTAPALIINDTRNTMNFWEKESVQIRKLASKNSLLYTWENPSGPRVLVWEIGQKKELENDLRKDGVGEYSVSENCEIFWVCFLDGMQRILLFTEDKTIAEGAQSARLFEQIQQEINVSIHGLGCSLVNNFSRQEIMYIGIASSGVIWEASKLHNDRYKQLSTQDSQHIETAYQHHILKGADSSAEGKTQVDHKIVVDFGLNMMYKPNKRKLRRTFQTGLWLQMKTSPSQSQLHAKINRIQIDNQMSDSIFPVVLAPVPPPKSVAADSGIKPFIEVSIVELMMKNSQIKQFKYFKVLVQEFHIKVDLGFVNAIVDLLQNAEYSDVDEKNLFLTDVSLVDQALYSHASTQSLQEKKSFYDLLHFSPLKIHVSFSMAAGTTAGQSVTTPNFITVLLQGLGVTLTDLQDVVFKLAYFEREYTFLTQRQLISELTSHYVGQSVKQLYVLVLGLDVLGNPYGLVLGITKGVEDLFYEPFQGAIQGPGEFAEGLVLGVRSLFGHTVGGAAGAVSRITGAMGKGIAALTFDDDFQRKRRDQMNKKPATVQEGLARGGKGLVMGVVDGVSGLVTKPISGAKEQGIEGFFKGLGKGTLGLVARPTAGVIDFASGSLDAVKRATEVGEETLRLRPPRFLQADGLVRLYNKEEAEGHKLLADLEKGKYAPTDVYVYHYVTVENKEVLLLTDKRLAYIVRSDLFGGWQIDWSYTWKEMSNPVKVVPKGILITTSEKKKKFFGSSDASKTILIADPQVKEDICMKIESLRNV